MKLLPKIKLYIPGVSIIFTVMVLLLITGVSTYRSLNRSEKRAFEYVHRQGSMLLRSLESGARAGMVMRMWSEDAVARLLSETAKDKDIVHIFLVNRNGVAVHHSIKDQEGIPASWHPLINPPDSTVSQIINMPDGSIVYQMAKRFEPGSKGIMGNQHRQTMHEHDDSVLVIGLSMRNFEQARKDDISHAIFMGGIITVLGAGSLFFLFIIQNYYLVGKTLTRAENYTRQVMLSMADGLLSLDAKGRLEGYNPQALSLLGLNENQVTSTQFDLSLWIDYKRSGIGMTLEKGYATLNHEFVALDKNGEPIPLSISVTPLKSGSGQTIGAVILLRDLREIKRLQKKVKQSEALAAVGKLSASVAHEIRNPLSSIKGFVQFLKNALQDGSQEREYAQLVIGEVDRIDAVVGDLLAYSRPYEPQCVFTDIRTLCTHCVDLVQADAKASQIALDIRCNPAMDKVNVDANKIKQALLNLVLNALEATPKGGRITVSVELDPHEQMLVIQVVDSGKGVSTALQQKIFEPFFSSREQGTGLGLAIVRKIVEGHGGWIDVESPPAGKLMGSAFVIKIPVAFKELTSKEELS